MPDQYIENKVYLSLGSNLGNRELNLVNAVRLIEEKNTLSKRSMICESRSWGYNDNDYLNMCIEIHTHSNPEELLFFTKSIETELGRTEKTKPDEHLKPIYKSRIIDIDILLYNNEIVQKENLIIPHPKLHLRRFVLMPLNEIAPDFVHPILKRNINTLYNMCKDNLRVTPYRK